MKSNSFVWDRLRQSDKIKWSTLYVNDLSLLDSYRNNSEVSPAVKAVLEEVKQCFLHHVRHLRVKTQGSLTCLRESSSAVLSGWSCSPRNLWGRGPPAPQASWREPHRKGVRAPSVNDKPSIRRLSARPWRFAQVGRPPPTLHSMTYLICLIANINIIKQQMTEMEQRWQVVQLS